MDLNQRKLTKSEWSSTEIPVSSDEKEILNLIIGGYHSVNIKTNKNVSLFGFLKIEYTEILEDYLYNKYFSEKINQLKKEYTVEKIFDISIKPNVVIKKADMIRLEQNDSGKMKSANIYEYMLIDLMENILKSKNHKHNEKDKEKEKNNNQWLIHYFTLYKLIRVSIATVNRHIVSMVNMFITYMENEIDMTEVISNAVEFIEKNQILLKYSDMTLYEHQKQLFTAVKNPGPKLILYIAPTGTGKTLSPIGLSENHRIIFVCAARHVGLALAKSAISVNKKIAVAFGCGSSADIRLHYFAAKDYSKNKRSGGIGKVDNTNGEKVEIIICDIKSFIPSMYYMTAFNAPEDIIVYWDEPTITMDYEDHELHPIIQNNWKQNIIPNMILSSATLPKLHELTETVTNFKEKFPRAQIHNIVSHDCKKSIPIINKNGYVVLPHSLSENFEDIKRSVQHCEENMSLLRYFDMMDVVQFILHVEKNDYIPGSAKIARHFASIDDVNMMSIKTHYLYCIKRIIDGKWNQLFNEMKMSRVRRICPNKNVDTKGNRITSKIIIGETIKKSASVGPGVSITSTNHFKEVGGMPLSRIASHQIIPTVTNTDAEAEEQTGIYITTKDAFTLTDGPTIFLANDVEKIAKFCIQQANIPVQVMKDIVEKIEYNNAINEKICILEKDLEDMLLKDAQNLTSVGGDKKANKKQEPRIKELANENGKKTQKIESDLEHLRAMIKSAQLNDIFVPNKILHLNKWYNGNNNANNINTNNVFTSDIDEATIIQIMLLNDVSDSWKILLMMGIGVFTNHPSISYMEIMKRLADQQKLYMIIASSDYIYGTNYQFCHGYLSKDMSSSQEKIIQAMGRIGRNNIQQNYSIRIRDDEQIHKLFYKEMDKPEVRNMNRLFS